MTRTLLFRLQDGKIRVLEEVIESWKREHDDAMRAQDVEDLIAECLSCWEDIRRSWVRTRRLATLNRLWDLQEAGTTVVDIISRAIRLLGNVGSLAETIASDTGHAIEGRDNVPEALREASELREHVNKTWPWDNRPILKLDRKMAEESRAKRARGESQNVTDILAGLQGSATLRQE